MSAAWALAKTKKSKLPDMLALVNVPPVVTSQNGIVMLDLTTI